MHPSSQQSSALLSPSPSPFPPDQYALGSSSIPLNSLPDHHHHHNPTEHHQLPQSWSQLLLNGLSSNEDERLGPSGDHFQPKKLENWEDQVLLNLSPIVDVKQVVSLNTKFYDHGDEELQVSKPAWSQIMPVFGDCVTSLSNNLVDFTAYNNSDGSGNQHIDHSSKCNNTGGGGVCKKARVQLSPSQPPLKVRKEKLGDRITALHQLVSPFGKTDTASVLLEAMGYIRFLQGQIEALSSPYLATNQKTQPYVQGEKNNGVFPEDPGQLLNDTFMKKKGAQNQDGNHEKPKDLRSRGLCLVPVACTQQVGSDNGADYWAPAFGCGF